MCSEVWILYTLGRGLSQISPQSPLSPAIPFLRSLPRHSSPSPPSPPFRVLLENFEELLPVVHRPTVHKVCQKYNLMFKTVPRALFITLDDRGRVFR